MDLMKFEVKPHPARDIFRKHKVPMKVVAKALNLSYPHVCAMLSGSLNVTKQNEAKIIKLCDVLEKD